MITLPVPPRRAMRRSFWLVASVALGATTGTSVWLLARPHGFIVGASLAGGTALAGWLWPQLVSAAYDAWNRLARFVGRGARAALLAICYFVVLRAVGKRGERFDVGRPTEGGSHWVERKSLVAEAYGMQFNAPSNGTVAGGWLRSYLVWAARAGNLWAVALLPFLAGIAVLEEDETQSLSATNYTLF